jgi:hypothetical protein
MAAIAMQSIATAFLSQDECQRAKEIWLRDRTEEQFTTFQDDGNAFGDISLVFRLEADA